MRSLRGLLGSAAALLVTAPTAPVHPHPDAELLAACAAFDKRVRACFDICRLRDGTGDAELDRLSDAEDPLVKRMCELRAITKEGTAARARSLVLWAPWVIDEESSYTDQTLLRAIIRDLASQVPT